MAAVGLLVPVVAAVAAAGSAAAAAITVTGSTAAGTSNLVSVACPTATTCIAVGTVGQYPNSVGVVVPIVDGTPQTATSVTGTAELLDVACTSPAACVAVGDANVNNGPGVVVAISNGTPGAVQNVANTFGLKRVACEPTTTTCVATSDRGGVVKITGGTSGPLQPVSGASGLAGVACTTPTTCEAVGERDGTNGPPVAGVLIAISNGTPGTATDVAGTSVLYGISCASANACEAVGSRNDANGFFVGGVAVAVTNGAAGTVHQVNAVSLFNTVVCPSTSVCLASGGVANGTPSQSITAIDGGIPGTPQVAPGSLAEGDGPHVVACATATVCVGLGETGTSSVGQVVPVNSEVVGTPIAATGSYFLFDVMCPSAINCIAVGSSPAGVGFVANITIPSATTTTAPTVQASPATVVTGQTTTVTGDGFPAGSTLQITLFSDPLLLATVTADSFGHFRAAVIIPAATTPGAHNLVVAPASGSPRAQTSIIVTAATGAATSTTMPQRLALTGTDARWPGRVAVALLLISVALMMVSRRQPGYRLRRR